MYILLEQNLKDPHILHQYPETKTQKACFTIYTFSFNFSTKLKSHAPFKKKIKIDGSTKLKLNPKMQCERGKIANRN
jgi:hypothetical protein